MSSIWPECLIQNKEVNTEVVCMKSNTTIIECLPCASNCTNHVTCLISFNSDNDHFIHYYYPNFRGVASNLPKVPQQVGGRSVDAAAHVSWARLSPCYPAF